MTGRVGRPGGGLGTAGPFPAVRCPRRARKGPPPGSPGGEDVLPAVKGASAGAAGTKKAAELQKISARPDQRPGCGNARAAQTDQAGEGTNRSPPATASQPKGLRYAHRRIAKPIAVPNC